jgi:hypothetical protein
MATVFPEFGDSGVKKTTLYLYPYTQLHHVTGLAMLCAAIFCFVESNQQMLYTGMALL